MAPPSRLFAPASPKLLKPSAPSLFSSSAAFRWALKSEESRATNGQEVAKDCMLSVGLAEFSLLVSFEKLIDHIENSEDTRFVQSNIAKHLEYKSKDSISNRGNNIYFGYKPSIFASNSSLRVNLMLSSNFGAQGFLPSTGTQSKHLASLSSQFLGEGDLLHENNVLPRRLKCIVSPRAYKDDIFKFRYPVIAEKPDWWWRTLACLPYLIALQISDTGYFLQPFLEHYEIFENLIFFVPGAIKRLPPWFSMIYCYFGYIGIVKNKDLPHFMRFHLMMGMLLETALQLIWYTCNFFPLIHYNGMFGMQFWAGIGFCYIFALLQCVRCALGGKYAHIPFVSDAAYIHTLFNIGSFQRPF